MAGLFASVKGAIRREWRQLWSTPWEWITTIALPVFWCVLMACLFQQGLMRELPVGVVDLDKTPQSLHVQGYFDALPSVKLHSLDSPEQALTGVRRGDLNGYIVIPEGWTRNARSTQADAIEIYIPKSIYAIGVNIEIDLKQALLAYSHESLKQMAFSVGANEKQADRLLNNLIVNTVLLGNIGFNFHAYLLATLFPGILGLTMILVTATSFVREFRDQTTRSWIKDANDNAWGAIVGKMLFWIGVYALLGLGYLAYFTGYAGWGIGASLGLWALAIVTLFVIMASWAVLFTSIFIPLGWVIVLSVCIGCTAPIYPYTGFSYPIESMTAGAQFLAHCFPLTHFMQLQSAAWVLHPPLQTWLVDWMLFALFAIVPLLIGIPLLKSRLEKFNGGLHE